MMTPQDFLRSITPGLKQPENLGLDKYVTVNADEVGMVVQNLYMEDESIFQKLSSGGLISFSDYIFLLTVLSTSRRHFEVAFKMFDLNGDGDVDAKEFEVVTNLMKSQSSMGARHRDHQNTGNTFKGTLQIVVSIAIIRVISLKLNFLWMQLWSNFEVNTLRFRYKTIEGCGVVVIKSG